MMFQAITDAIVQKTSQYKMYIVFVAICAVVGMSCWWGGYYAHKPETITKTQTITVEKIVEKQVAVTDHSTTEIVIKKPDGTTETTVVHNDINTSENTKIQEKDKIVAKDETKETAISQPKYSVGAQAQVDPMNPLKPSYNATIGYRILGNAWVDALYNMGHKEVAIGFSIKF